MLIMLGIFRVNKFLSLNKFSCNLVVHSHWIVFKRSDNAEKEPANLKTSEQEFSNWKREEKNNWKN